MSRGMGSVQQGILHCLAGKKTWDARSLARTILNSTSPAALVSIRRAARALEAAGLIVTVPDISTSKFWRLAAANKHYQAKTKAKERKRAGERRQEEERDPPPGDGGRIRTAKTIIEFQAG
jgi:hypothetical protein